MKNRDDIFMAIIVLLITTILVAMMSVQFKTIDETDVAEIETMQESELRTEIASWKTKYSQIEEQINNNKQKTIDYQDKIDTNQQAGELLNNEVLEKNMMSGRIATKGEGVVVTLQDGPDGIVESEDLLELINELRYAGAEAISVNEQRIIFDSYIVSVGSKYISLDGARVLSPYTVKAIGNQSYLSSTLNLKNSGYVDRYNSSGKKVSVTLNSEILIPAYKGEIKLENINN
ncbi:MAG TPA: DUF881 domain-containing protein [Clostridia bacterium]|nr:DUF881 domain-containing protein [Clostridia bacterium]